MGFCETCKLISYAAKNRNRSEITTATAPRTISRFVSDGEIHSRNILSLVFVWQFSPVQKLGQIEYGHHNVTEHKIITIFVHRLCLHVFYFSLNSYRFALTALHNLNYCVLTGDVRNSHKHFRFGTFAESINTKLYINRLKKWKRKFQQLFFSFILICYDYYFTAFDQNIWLFCVDG